MARSFSVFVFVPIRLAQPLPASGGQSLRLGTPYRWVQSICGDRNELALLGHGFARNFIAPAWRASMDPATMRLLGRPRATCSSVGVCNRTSHVCSYHAWSAHCEPIPANITRRPTCPPPRGRPPRLHKAGHAHIQAARPRRRRAGRNAPTAQPSRRTKDGRGLRPRLNVITLRARSLMPPARLAPVRANCSVSRGSGRNFRVRAKSTTKRIWL